MHKLVSTLFQEYLSTQKLADNSIAIKKRAFKQFLSILGDCELPSNSGLAIKKYLDTLCEKTSVQTAETYKRNLSAFFKWLVAHNYLEKNIALDIQIKQPASKTLVIFRPEELKCIFAIADKRWRAIIALGLCGLRRSEVLNVCRTDFDLNSGTVLITSKIDSALMWQWENMNCLQTPISLPKTIHFGRFEIHPQDEVKELLDLTPSSQPYVCLKPQHYALMLQKKIEGVVSFDDRNCPWRSFTRDFGLLLKKAKVEHKRFGDLRVTYSASLARMRLNVKSARELLRHRNTLTTYTHYQRYQKDLFTRFFTRKRDGRKK